MEGWIKLHKRLASHDLLRDDNAYKLFTVLLMYVNTQSGSYTAGRFQLGDMAKMKPITAYKALKRLEKKWEMVTLVSNNQYTEITVCNWSLYQSRSTQRNTIGNNAVTAGEQRGNTNKDIRNKKKERETSSINFLKDLPKETREEITKKFDCSRDQLEKKCQDLIEYCEMHGKRYKNYKAFLLKAIRRDYGERKDSSAIHARQNQHAAFQGSSPFASQLASKLKA